MQDPNNILFQGSGDDLRFSLEIVKQLSESVRQTSESARVTAAAVNDLRVQMHEDRSEIRERLVRIESNRVSEDVVRIDGELKAAVTRIKTLESDKDKRDGSRSAIDYVFRNWPGLIGIIAVIVTILKANGKI